MELLVGLVLWTVAILYLIWPLFLRFKHQVRAEPKFTSLDSAELPREVWDYMHGTAEALRDLGFKPMAYAALPEQSPGVRNYTVLLQHAATGERASTTAIFIKRTGRWQLLSCSADFGTEYADGTVASTNNLALPMILALPGRYRVAQLPNVTDTGKLLEIHRFRVHRLARHDAPVLPQVPPLEHLAQRLKEIYDLQVERGVFFLDGKNGVYRPTLKGAYLLMWRQLWPLKGQRLRRVAREAGMLRAEMEGLRKAGTWPPNPGGHAASSGSAPAGA